MLLPPMPRARIASVHHQPGCFTWMLSLDLRSSSMLSKRITHRACSTQVSDFQVFFFSGSFEFAEFLQNQCGTPVHLRLLLFCHLSQGGGGGGWLTVHECILHGCQPVHILYAFPRVFTAPGSCQETTL